MKRVIDLKNDPVKSSFYKYLMPAIFAMVVKSVYVLVDAVFVGVGVGTAGLGAISLSVPFFSLSSAIALMIGIGGSSIMSIQLGKGNKEEAQGIFAISMLSIFVIISVLVTIAMFNVDTLVMLLGAEGELAEYSSDYLRMMLPFFVFHGLWWVLSSFIRNDTNPKLVMYATMGSALVNVVLDYVFLFVFGWGVTGAAFATGLSQIVTFVVLLTHFKSGKGMLKLSLKEISLRKIPKIINTGLPTFFVESTTAITVLVFNMVLLAKYSALHVAAYGIVMNIGLVGLFMLIGVSQASQPIISFNHGANRLDKIKEVLGYAMRYGLLIGMAITIVTITFSRPLASLFTESDYDLIELASSAMKIYFLAPPLMALNTVVAMLFQSTEKPIVATVIAISRGFTLVLVGLFLLPELFPVNGVWGAVLFAETVTAVYSVYQLVKFLKVTRLKEVYAN